RTVVDRYRFPAQETSIRDDSDLELTGPDGGTFGKVVAIDLLERTVDVKKNNRFMDLHPTSFFAHKVVRSDVMADSLSRLGEWVAGHGVDADSDHRAARDLLLGRPPRVAGHAGGALEQPGEGGERAARRR